MSEILACLPLAAAVLLLRVLVVSLARVKVSSMQTALHDGDWLLVWRLPCRLRGPKRQQVVICRYPGRYWRGIRLLPMSFVKRVIALPGETIEVADGRTLIDGVPLAEPYLSPEKTRFWRARPPRAVPEGTYYVLGDNRDNSNDSRSVGPLAGRAIRGHAVCIIWPPKRIGRI